MNREEFLRLRQIKHRVADSTHMGSRQLNKPDVAKPITTRVSHKRKLAYLMWFVVGFLVILGGTGTAVWINRGDGTVNGISAQVRKEAGFKLYSPPSGVDQTTVKYDSSQKGVSYILNGPQKVTVSQQSLPDQFIDIDGYSAKFFSGLSPYATIDTELGKAYLTNKAGKPDVAVISTGTTLLFISSDTKLDQSTWTTIINSLEAVK